MTARSRTRRRRRANPRQQSGLHDRARWFSRSLLGYARLLPRRVRRRLTRAATPRATSTANRDTAVTAAMLRPRVSPDRLRRRLESIVGERHHATSPRHHARVAATIRDGFAEYGWQLHEQEVLGPHGVGANIIGGRRGTATPERVWILGAHYDTVIGTPGADDNGIAVAGLLVAAEVLASMEFCDTVELVAWDMEEAQGEGAGSLLGSTVMATEAFARGRDIAGVLDFEMIGFCRREPGTQSMPLGFGALFPDVAKQMKRRGLRGDFLTGVGNRRSAPLLDALGRAAASVDLPFIPIQVTGAARLVRHFYRSDHAPFWTRGYPAVMLTDTADFRNGHYHQASDTIDTIDFDYAAQVTAAAVVAVVELAGGMMRHASP